MISLNITLEDILDPALRQRDIDTFIIYQIIRMQGAVKNVIGPLQYDTTD